MIEFWENYAYICSIITTLCRNRLVSIILKYRIWKSNII